MKKFLGQSVDQDTASELDKYIREGGFPKTLEYENPDDKRIYIHSTLSEIFEKDIRRRVNYPLKRKTGSMFRWKA